jgi:hypothetical protein
VRYQDGILEGAPDEVDTIHADLAQVASRISLSAMMRATLTTACGCHALHAVRPADYAMNAQGDAVRERAKRQAHRTR